MYKRRSRLPSRQQGELLKMFVVGATARAAAEVVGVHRNTAASFFMRLRKLIASKLQRGRGAAGKVAVFGLLKRGGKVYTAIVPNSKTATLLPIIGEKVSSDSIVYTDTFRSYNALDISDFHHRRINHSKFFADKRNHINGIENFWNQTKRNLRKFNGIKAENFYWFLKDCEWRFNSGDHQSLLKQLKYWYKSTKH